MRAESFPVFAALLNALHRGVAVRIVTNNYNNPAQPAGTVPMLDFLVLNGANVSYYTSTTFMHAKYMAIDGKVVSISSVNYSLSSYMYNREAGLYITGSAVVKFCAKVFDYDFSAAIPLVPGSYSPSDMRIITDPTQIKVTLPLFPPFFFAKNCSLNVPCPFIHVS
jgi:phosphatidylserine/phosphatidylglycerophosphate/cardiolipin synthase-like enzyme